VIVNMREELDGAYADPGLPEATGGGEAVVAITGGTESQREEAAAALRSIYDPEIPVNIYDLGLVYAVHFLTDGVAKVIMTLTSPGCPAAVILPGEVEEKIGGLYGVEKAEVELVWDPPWSPERMSEAARLELGMM
jgi:FeS assembly SUF system protein